MRHHVIFLFLFGISNLLSLFLLINSRESNCETMHQCHYCNQTDYRIILNSTICQYLVIYLIRYTHPLALCICSQTIGTVTKSNRKIIERGKIDTPETQIHDCSFSWFCSCTCGKVKLVLWTIISPLNEMVRLFKCFPRVS